MLLKIGVLRFGARTRGLEWFCDTEFIQVFIKLQRSVLIVDFAVDENELKIKNHLHVQLDIWNPGSIQVNRINDGR